MAETFGDLSGGRWQMHQATSADAALSILKQQKIDLAVVDINMPLLDGLQFLRILNRRYPNVKKVTLTGYASEENRAACLATGAEMFIEKPHTLEGFKSVFVILEELVSWAPAEGFQGLLRQVGLDDIIQMECLGRNSSILEVQNRQLWGRIYIEDGSILHAVLGDETGEKALHKLLAVTGGEFKLLPFTAPETRTIEGPWEFLLMEAARVRDEMASQSPAAVSASATPVIPVSAAGPAAAPAAEPVPAAPAPPPAPVKSAPSVVLTETLVCSAQGNPVYHWQCPGIMDRVALLQNIAQQAALLEQTVPLGKLDRLEIRQPDRRSVALFGEDRLVFISVAKAPAAK